MFGAVSNFFAAFSVDTKINIKYTTYYPGNVVEGVVVVATTKPVDVRAIRVKIVGRENAHIVTTHHTTDSQGHQHTHHEHHNQSNCFFKQLVTLAGCLKFGPQIAPWTINPGTYYYPFAFHLPPALPASLYIQQGEQHAGIFYQVKAYVDIANGRDSVARAPFSIVRPLRMDQWQNPGPVTIDRYFDISCCCCISKGKNACRFYIDRTIIAVDRDDLVICADIDNTNCEEPVNAVVISLDHVFTGRAQGREFSGKVSAGSQRLAQKVEAKGKGRVAGTFKLPRSAIPSAQTALVTSLYKVTIELDIPWASDPSHEFNVTVAQTVDATNSCPPLLWGESYIQTLPKGYLSSPEVFYAPPPCPVYNFVPIPNSFVPQGAPVQQYGDISTVAPLGLPDAQWSANAPQVVAKHQQQVTAPLGMQWQQGYTQTPQQSIY